MGDMGEKGLDEIEIEGTAISAVPTDSPGVKHLGVLVFHEFGGTAVPTNIADGHIKKNKTLSKYIENAAHPLLDRPSDLDAFRKTCSPSNIRIWEKIGGPTLYEIESDLDAHEDGDRAEKSFFVSLPALHQRNVYILERRLWYRKETGSRVKMTPTHPKVARLRFTSAVKDTDGNITHAARIDIDMLDDVYAPLASQIRGIAEAEWERQRKVYDEVRFKRAFRRMAREMWGIRFAHTMGVTFVPNEGEKLLRAFSDLLKNVASEYRYTLCPIRVRVIPVIATEEMKQAIAEDVARESQIRFDKILEDVAQYLSEKEEDLKGANKKQKEAIAKQIDSAIQGKLKSKGDIAMLRNKYQELLGVKIKQVSAGEFKKLGSVRSLKLMTSTEKELKELTKSMR